MSRANKWLRQIARFFRGKSHFYPRGQLFENHARNYRNCFLMVRAFYGYSLLGALDSYQWMIRSGTNKVFYDPLWVFGNFPPDKIQYLTEPFCYGWIATSLLCVFYFQYRAFRVLQAVSIFYVIAILNSDGHFANSSHIFLWVSLILAFIRLPSENSARPQRVERHKLILSVWFLQLMICTFYLMAGYWKVISIVNCAVNPELDCQLDRWILTNMSAREAIFYNKYAPWRDLFYHYPWISFASYMGTLWIHLVSLYFAFRLDLHRTFGIFRLVFHLGTFLFFGVNFSATAIPVAFIFLLSPFDRVRSGRDILKELLRLPPLNWRYSKGAHDPAK